MSQAKVSTSDYRQALINRNNSQNETFINEVLKIAFKIKSSKFWNYYYWIPLFKDSENDLIRKLSTNEWKYHKQLDMSDSIDLDRAYVDNDEFKNKIQSLDLIKDDFIIVDLETIEMINKWREDEKKT